MHFIFQALHRRPLEPKSLAISRGVSAIFLSLVFLAYVGYLIYQIYTDSRLLIISTQNLQSYRSPDVEMCVYGSPFDVTSCSLIDMQFNNQVIPGCTPYLTGSPSNNTGPQWCIVFQTDSLGFGVDLGKEGPTPSPGQMKMIRRVDIYWAISNLTAYNLYNPWTPSVTVTLYSPEFSSWRIKPENMIPQQATAWRNLQLQRHVSTTIMNYWNTVYFTPAKYRAIRPYDPLSILGINSSFIDIDTLHTVQHDWPLNNASINYTKYGNYQGVLSFMLAAGDMEVRTEQRNHTVLAALALAGGCYGVIFAIYCVLYGTPKLTPFGFTHGMSIWYHRGKNKLGRKKTDGDDDDSPQTNLPLHRNSKNRLLSLDGASIHSNNSIDSQERFGTNVTYHSLESIHPTTIQMDTINNRNVVNKNIGENHDDGDCSTILPTTTAVAAEQLSVPSAPSQRQASHSSSHNLTHLEFRVQELESILREYFLDVDYLDALRIRHMEYMEPTTASDTNRRPPCDRKSDCHDFSLLESMRTRKSITGQEWAMDGMGRAHRPS